MNYAEKKIQIISGYVFDIYSFEEKIFIWLKDDAGIMHLVQDIFYPEIFVSGDRHIITKLIQRLHELDVLAQQPQFVTKRHFYGNFQQKVIQIKIKKTSFLRTIYKKLYHFFDKIDIYHSDIEIPAYYMLVKNIYPLAYVSAQYEDQGPGHEKKLLSINAKFPKSQYHYTLPSFKTIALSFKQSHRLPLSLTNPLLVQTKTEQIQLAPGKEMAHRIREIMLAEDPDIILSAFGDQKIFPFLFSLAQKAGVDLYVDRDPSHVARKIITKGTSFNTYGNMIYKAPSYPLFGRWHIDSSNSFVYKESQIFGIIELARMSCLPVQKMARASTGTALTYMEIENAFAMDYLIPWQKSSMEQPKTAYELLQIDKGGLVFEPDLRHGIVFTDVVQLDFAQMYPTIMVNHNISPETVLCPCCGQDPRAERVPEAGYHICRRRRGIVSRTLESILKRRQWLKQRKQDTRLPEKERKIADEKQKAIKWLLVTSFGYLGYRNAKFGRLESHEAVTAFGREKLLIAKEISEKKGYDLINAITDSLFIQRPVNDNQHNLVISDQQTSYRTISQIIHLQRQIDRETGVQISHEGTYAWLVFLPSKIDGQSPVSNRYFGLFDTGELKIRGIFARRKDIPRFCKQAQISFLEIMRTAMTLEQLRGLHKDLHEQFMNLRRQLQERAVPWTDLLLRKTVSKDMDAYQVNNATVQCLRQLRAQNIHVQPGEKVRYVIIDKKKQKYMAEEIAWQKQKSNASIDYDVKAYNDLLLESFREVWQPFAPRSYFEDMGNETKQLDLFHRSE